MIELAHNFLFVCSVNKEMSDSKHISLDGRKHSQYMWNKDDRRFNNSNLF